MMKFKDIMNQNEIIYAKKLECAPLFSSRCFCCHKKFGKGFVFHHKYYSNQGKVYTDKGYHDVIYDEIKKNPFQFLLLCVKCHFIVEKLKRMNPTRLNRIVKVVRMKK